jgi:hypothetical protein
MQTTSQTATVTTPGTQKSIFSRLGIRKPSILSLSSPLQPSTTSRTFSLDDLLRPLPRRKLMQSFFFIFKLLFYLSPLLSIFLKLLNTLHSVSFPPIMHCTRTFLNFLLSKFFFDVFVCLCFPYHFHHIS